MNELIEFLLRFGNLNQQQINFIISKTKETYKKEVTEEIEGVYVNHAGIVLLHPFMAPLFTNLNLLEKGKWKDEKSQIKAVYLLAYMATGSMNFFYSNICVLYHGKLL